MLDVIGRKLWRRALHNDEHDEFQIDVQCM